jgi:glycosyltransferase involved in cell wall biosynthesis
VELTGWVPHEELHRYLNEIRLLVIPSYTEALSVMMLEAMACGTPVLAPPFGAIPQIIRDGETGFLLENNTPECISRNILRALSHPRLEEIARNARTRLEKEFTLSGSIEKWRGLIDGLKNARRGTGPAVLQE